MIQFIPFHNGALSKLSTNNDLICKVNTFFKPIPTNLKIYDVIYNLSTKYVIFGIEEDLGVFANEGILGTKKAWKSALQQLLCLEESADMNSKNATILGKFKIDNYKFITLAPSTRERILVAGQIVNEINKEVSYLVSAIVKAGKIPIIVGGGQNNSYGIIKGTALALNQSINIINLDILPDFKAEELHHNGNAFSYAYSEGFIKRYYNLGLHQNLISEASYNTINKFKQIKYTTFEAIEIKKTSSFDIALNEALNFIANRAFGIEVDCKIIQGIPSSYNNTSGFTINQTKQFVKCFSENSFAKYLHISEAIPQKNNKKQVGKLICSLITAFIKKHQKKQLQ